MKKIILINGVIAGLIISGIMVLTHPLVDDGTIDMDNGMFLGYTSMVLGFAMIFVAIKSYRDGEVIGGTFFADVGGRKIHHRSFAGHEVLPVLERRFDAKLTFF